MNERGVGLPEDEPRLRTSVSIDEHVVEPLSASRVRGDSDFVHVDRVRTLEVRPESHAKLCHSVTVDDANLGPEIRRPVFPSPVRDGRRSIRGVNHVRATTPGEKSP